MSVPEGESGEDDRAPTTGINGVASTVAINGRREISSLPSHPPPSLLALGICETTMAKSMSRDGGGDEACGTRPTHQVAASRASQPPVPVTQLPEIDPASPEARAEMLRVVRERFPIRSTWPGVSLEIIQAATFEERARFVGDDVGMDYDLIFWAIQGAESEDPVRAAKWARFKVRNPSRLNIRPPSVVQIASIPPKFLPLGTVLPRVP